MNKYVSIFIVLSFIIFGKPIFAFQRIIDNNILKNNQMESKTELNYLSFNFVNSECYDIRENIKIGVPNSINVGISGYYEFSDKYNDNPGDIELSLSKEFLKEEFRRPGFIAKGFLKYGGRDDIFTSTGELDWGGTLNFYKNLREDIILSIDLGATIRSDRPGYSIDNSFDYGIGIKKIFDDNISITGELYGKTSAYDSSVSIAVIGCGIDYRMTELLDLYAFLGLGLNDRAPDVDVSLGASLNFGLGYVKSKDLINDREQAENYIRLGYRYSLNDDWTRAGEAYKKAAQIDPSNTRALNNLASSYIELGKFEEGLSVLKKAQILAPNDPDIHYNLGLTYLKLNDLVNAKAEWEKTVSLNPAHKGAVRNLRILKLGGIGE